MFGQLSGSDPSERSVQKIVWLNMSNIRFPTLAPIIGGAVKKKRLELGLTLAQLGDATGIDRSRIWRFENGVRQLGLSKLGILLDYLDLEVMVQVRAKKKQKKPTPPL